MSLHPNDISTLVDLGIIVLVAAGFVAFVTITTYFVQGQIAPYEPRCRVPWQWFDLIVVFGLYLFLASYVALTDNFAAWTDSFQVGSATEPPSLGSEEDIGTHPLIVLIREQHSPYTLILAVLVAVVVAPILEEFLFRLLLQGWLESMETCWRRWIPGLRWLTRGVIPVSLASLLFGAMHYRPGPIDQSVEEMIRVLSQGVLNGLLFLPLAVIFLRNRCSATFEDLGIVPGKFFRDVGIGLIAFLAIVVPTYLMRASLNYMFQRNPIVDPITLFFFAIVLGALYYRTHRIVSAITLHMALNATSLTMVWFML